MSTLLSAFSAYDLAAGVLLYLLCPLLSACYSVMTWRSWQRRWDGQKPMARWLTRHPTYAKVGYRHRPARAPGVRDLLSFVGYCLPLASVYPLVVALLYVLNQYREERLQSQGSQG